MSNPQQFDASTMLQSSKLELTYPEQKDGWITKTALYVIAGAATISGLVLIFSIVWFDCDAVADQMATCKFSDPPEWAPEMLRLALVSSLAFVMGSAKS